MCRHLLSIYLLSDVTSCSASSCSPLFVFLFYLLFFFFFFRDLFQLIPASYWTRAHYARPLQYCPVANSPVWISFLSVERETELFVQHCLCLNVSKERCRSSDCLFVCSLEEEAIHSLVVLGLRAHLLEALYVNNGT